MQKYMIYALWFLFPVSMCRDEASRLDHEATGHFQNGRYNLAEAKYRKAEQLEALGTTIDRMRTHSYRALIVVTVVGVLLQYACR